MTLVTWTSCVACGAAMSVPSLGSVGLGMPAAVCISISPGTFLLLPECQPGMGALQSHNLARPGMPWPLSSAPLTGFGSTLALESVLLQSPSADPAAPGMECAMCFSALGVTVAVLCAWLVLEVSQVSSSLGGSGVLWLYLLISPFPEPFWEGSPGWGQCRTSQGRRLRQRYSAVAPALRWECVPPSLSPAACPQALGQRLARLLEQKPVLDPDIPYLNIWFTALSGCFTNALCTF